MKSRILSLDVFRGMTIFFMILVNTPGSWSFVYAPLTHAKWDGCTPTDLVFPFFMLIVGISMSISFSKFNTSQHNIWIKKVIIRGLKIILIGLVLNWFPFFNKNIENLRFFGVLQRIGLSFLIVAVIIPYINREKLLLLLSAILTGYWVILLTAGDGALTLEGNLVRKFDIILFGEKHIYKGYGIPFDPEGLLSTIPSIGTVLFGYLAGLSILRIEKISNKIKWLLSCGIFSVVIGAAWSYIGFPINKPIWSSSYVLYTGGIGLIFLAFLMWVIDYYQIKKWTFVFKAFGQNPLVCFVLSGLIVKTISLIKIGDQSLYALSYNRFFKATFGDYFGSFMFALTFVMLIWVIAWYMDRKSIIVKV